MWSSFREEYRTAFLYSTAKLQMAVPELSGVGGRENPNKLSGWSGAFLVESGGIVPRFPMLENKAGPSLGSKERQKAPAKPLSSALCPSLEASPD